MSSSTSKSNPWTRVTRDDVAHWAGARALAKGEGYVGHVEDLALAPPSQILAWVWGNERYATTVIVLGKKEPYFQSWCSCPVGSHGCKHAVAAALVYLERLSERTEVPVAGDGDPRWALLAEDLGGVAADEDVDDNADNILANIRQRAGKQRRQHLAQLRSLVEGQSRVELIELVTKLLERHPEAAEELIERQALRSGDVARVVAKARKDIDELTQEPAWIDEWSRDGNVPDYSQLKNRLQKLLDHGQADAVLELGQCLFEAGQRQVEESQDEGETAAALAECLDVIFKAIPSSTLTDAQKILYVIGMQLRDEYDLTSGAELVWQVDWPQAAWSEVADELLGQLGGVPAGREDDFSYRYRRDRLTSEIARALDAAGRLAEAQALLEAEANRTGSYWRVVDRWLAAGRLDDAERWAREGIANAPTKWPGMATELQQRLQDIAKCRKDWPLAAAYEAENFFAGPSRESFASLLKVAAKAKCKQPVESAARQSLETGIRPDRNKGSARSDWPLPHIDKIEEAPGYKEAEARPHWDVLLDMALADKDSESILYWYDRWEKSHNTRAWGRAREYADDVADAVADAYPDRALAIYQKRLAELLTRAERSAYEEAGVMLQKIRHVLLASQRNSEWTDLITRLRDQYRRRPRFLEVLDGVERRTAKVGSC